jgi:hypothetical protein
VPAAGDHDAGERLRDRGDVGERARVGLPGQVQVDHAEGVAALGHGHHDPFPALLGDAHDLLAA